MRAIISKEVNKFHKLNMLLCKSKDYKNNQLNSSNHDTLIKRHLGSKLMRQNSPIKSICLPLSLHYKQNIKNFKENSLTKKNKYQSYCITESNINNKQNNNKILPNIKHMNNYSSNKIMPLYNINFGLNNVNNNNNITKSEEKSKDIITNKINNIKDRFTLKIKKLNLKEIILSKSRNKKKEQLNNNLLNNNKSKFILKRINPKNNFNTLIKNYKDINKNDSIMNYEYQGYQNYNINKYDRLNIYMKYQQKPLNKRNNDQFKTFNELKRTDIEKNNSINSSLNSYKNGLINDKKNFKSMKVLSKINSSKKSRTIDIVNNDNFYEKKANKKQNSMDMYIPKKNKIKNDDILNLLENIDN